jgi:hypothetical protein
LPDLAQLTAARDHYREQFGWPVSVDIEHQGLIVAVGEAVGAVTIPALRGGKVHDELRITMLAGPVLASQGGRWWTFLVTPARKERTDLLAELRRPKVYSTPSGAHVIIPTFLNGTDGRWWWIQQPQPHSPLSPWSVVIGTTRRVAASQQPLITVAHA